MAVPGRRGQGVAPPGGKPSESSVEGSDGTFLLRDSVEVETGLYLDAAAAPDGRMAGQPLRNAELVAAGGPSCGQQTGGWRQALVEPVPQTFGARDEQQRGALETLQTEAAGTVDLHVGRLWTTVVQNHMLHGQSCRVQDCSSAAAACKYPDWMHLTLVTLSDKLVIAAQCHLHQHLPLQNRLSEDTLYTHATRYHGYRCAANGNSELGYNMYIKHLDCSLKSKTSYIISPYTCKENDTSVQRI